MSYLLFLQRDLELVAMSRMTSRSLTVCLLQQLQASRLMHDFSASAFRPPPCGVSVGLTITVTWPRLLHGVHGLCCHSRG